jgi:hypothetical protein
VLGAERVEGVIISKTNLIKAMLLFAPPGTSTLMTIVVPEWDGILDQVSLFFIFFFFKYFFFFYGLYI